MCCIIKRAKSVGATGSRSSAAVVSTRRRLVRASSAASSSSAGSETRFLLVGHSSPACRRAPSVSVCWWTHSSETRSQVQPAAASSRAFSSFWSSPVRSTKEHLETAGAQTRGEWHESSGMHRDPGHPNTQREIVQETWQTETFVNSYSGPDYWVNYSWMWKKLNKLTE